MILLLLLFSSSWALPFLDEGNARIINGSDAKRHQFPYIVSFNNGRHFCGGSIVSPTWVISAGHCFVLKQDPPNSVIAIAGLLNQNETHPDVQKVPVSKAVIHPDFVFDPIKLILKNDIALVNLAEPLVFSKAVQPITLPHSEDKFSGRVWMSGWGNYTLFPETAPITLQCLQMNLITNKVCREVRKKFHIFPPFTIADHMVCTTPLATNHNSTGCHGDSGGPMVQNNVLIGIISFGDFYCKTDVEVPTNVFTRNIPGSSDVSAHAAETRGPRYGWALDVDCFSTFKAADTATGVLGYGHSVIRRGGVITVISA